MARVNESVKCGGNSKGNNANNINCKKRGNYSKKVAVLALLTIILMLLIIIIGAGYAKLITSKTASISGNIGSMICNLDVQVDSSGSTPNPTCIVTVNDFNVVNNDYVITDTSVDYRIEVTPKTQGFVLPTYYWKAMNGDTLQTNGARTGTFYAGVQRADVYRLEFVNSGETDITAQVDISITAVQSQSEPEPDPDPGE